MKKIIMLGENKQANKLSLFNMFSSIFPSAAHAPGVIRGSLCPEKHLFAGRLEMYFSLLFFRQLN